MTLTRSVLVLVSLLLATEAADAAARRYRWLAPVEIAEGKGCYWERGREFCGAYCYYEVNGKRYCRERLRDAHSQAPFEVPVPDERLK